MADTLEQSVGLSDDAFIDLSAHALMNLIVQSGAGVPNGARDRRVGADSSVPNAPRLCRRAGAGVSNAPGIDALGRSARPGPRRAQGAPARTRRGAAAEEKEARGARAKEATAARGGAEAELAAIGAERNLASVERRCAAAALCCTVPTARHFSAFGALIQHKDVGTLMICAGQAPLIDWADRLRDRHHRGLRVAGYHKHTTHGSKVADSAAAVHMYSRLTMLLQHHHAGVNNVGAELCGQCGCGTIRCFLGILILWAKQIFPTPNIALRALGIAEMDSPASN